MARLLTLVSLIVLAGATAHATQIQYRSPRDLGREASLVVEGTVRGSRSYWNDSHTKILTETTVDVQSTYKGGETSVVRVLQLGGVVGNVRQSVAGALAWRPGEEVVLFLETLPGGDYRVGGFSQGKFTVERDPDTGRTFVSAPPSGGAEMVGAPEGTMPQGSPQRMSVENFINQALGRR